MDNKSEVLQQAYNWLSLRLQRAAKVEKELLDLISRPTLDEQEQKRYEALIQDNKAISIKDVVGVVDSLEGENENVVGFEDFE